MTLPLKPESLALVYEYNRSMPPFSSIKKMPHADDVEFWVVKDRSRIAWCQWMGERYRISVSANGVGHSSTLLMFMGHEQCHVAEDVLGFNPGGNENVHGVEFRKLAARFCKVHGFDLKAFY